MKSIRTKLVVYALILVLVPFLFSNIANYFYMSTSYEKELKHDNEVSAQLIGSEIASFIDKGYAITEQLIMNSDIIGFDPDKQKAVLMNVLDRNAYFDLLYVQDATGMQTAKTSGELGNRSERWWFIKAMEEKVSFVSNSYYSITGNVAVTTIAMPIFNWANQCIGVMGADIKLDALQKIVDGYSEGSKYAFIVDGEGAVIAHPDTEQVKKLYNYVTMKKTELSTDESGNVIFDDKGNQVTEEIDIQVPETLQKIVSLALDGQTGSEIYKNNEGVEVISAYSSITLPGTSDSWAVITVENKSDAFHFISTSLIFSIFLCIVSIVLTIILVSIIAKRISTPIKKSAEYLSKLSTGDFSIEVDSKLMAKRDETGTIAKGIQEMKEALKSLVASITKESQSINEAIGSVTANMSQLNAHIESVSATTEEFAASTEESAASSEEISATFMR